MTKTLGSSGTCLLFAGFSLVGLVAINVLVLETKGLQLDEVKKFLQKVFKPFPFDQKKEDNTGKEQADYGLKPLEIVFFFSFFFKL